jgi:hypothetical protein
VESGYEFAQLDVGFINQDRNNPRDIQLGLRLTF